MSEYESLLAAHSAAFQGIIRGPKENLVMFLDLQSGSTLALPESEFCSLQIAKRLAESRRAFGLPPAQ